MGGTLPIVSSRSLIRAETSNGSRHMRISETVSAIASGKMIGPLPYRSRDLHWLQSSDMLMNGREPTLERRPSL